MFLGRKINIYFAHFNLTRGKPKQPGNLHPEKLTVEMKRCYLSHSANHSNANQNRDKDWNCLIYHRNYGSTHPLENGDRERKIGKAEWMISDAMPDSIQRGRKLLNCRAVSTKGTRPTPGDVNHIHRPRYGRNRLNPLIKSGRLKLPDACKSPNAPYYPRIGAFCARGMAVAVLNLAAVPRATLSGTINYFQGVFSG